MGVHGLTTYLRENQRHLSKTLEFPNHNDDLTPAVVDGWSFIYNLHHNCNLPWVYGGEYAEFSRLVDAVVRAWIAVGLRLFFVFDGPAPPIKSQTLVTRMGQQVVQPSLLFFRTSPTSRSTPRFLSETRMIPPLYFSPCVRTLQAIAEETGALEIHFADEEGDPYSVELAGRIGGYVIGMDSDFVVLNSEGYLGYVPLDEMVWSTPSAVGDAPPEGEGDGDFQPVRKSKGKKKTVDHATAGQGIIPPITSSTSELTLSCNVYHPSTLASQLGLPVALLPLVGALVGNDFSNQSASPRRNAQLMFFQRQLTLSQRITRVASTLQSILSGSSQKKKQKHQVGSVMDLIDRTITALLIRSPSNMASGEKEEIVEKVVEAALQYAIPKYEGEVQGHAGLWSTEVCALHEPDTCPLVPLFSRSIAEIAADEGAQEEIAAKNQLKSLYITAYRSGRLHPQITDILGTGTYWCRLFLENPDFESVGQSIGRPIREWVYALLDHGVGLLDQGEEENGDENSQVTGDEEEDDDELIDVVEESDSDDNEDLLAPLRGQLQQLRNAEEQSPATDHPPSESSRSQSIRPSRPKTVVEYVRRGTRVAPEEVFVPSISQLLPKLDSFDAAGPIPLQLRCDEDRLSVFLYALHSDVASVRTLPPDQLGVALAVRWVVWIMYHRARESGGSKERQKERWTRNEAQALLASLSRTHVSETEAAIPDPVVPPIENRNVQLMAQILMSIKSIEHLSQTLLLTERVASPVHILSGRKFHSLLSGARSMGANDIPSQLWDACTDGLEEAFAEDRKKVGRKEAKERNNSSSSTSGVSTGTSKRTPKGGLFHLLADMEG